MLVDRDSKEFRHGPLEELAGMRDAGSHRTGGALESTAVPGNWGLVSTQTE